MKEGERPGTEPGNSDDRFLIRGSAVKKLLMLDIEERTPIGLANRAGT
jgi:hypothetical protein